MPRMIVDCDPGHDDAIALIVAHAYAEVLGVTTVAGNAPLVATTANALLMTALLGVDTPVHSGAAEALAGPAPHAQAVHGSSGLGGVTRIEHDRNVASTDAVGFLLEAPGPDDWIVALGPLTNLALAIERDPGWVRRIAGISIMGGSATVGNVTRVAEFNIWADPEAAVRVFGAGADLTMCGLNLTHQFRSSDAVTERLRRVDNPLAALAAESFDYLHARMAEFIGSRDAALHDPCAVFAVTHPELIRTEARAVGVETEGALTRGMTVVDQRVSRRRDPENVRVAYGIDAEGAWDLTLAALGAS